MKSEEMHNRFILIVEDNPDEAELAVLAMREKGISMPCHIVSDGQEAIDFVLGQGENEASKPHSVPFIILLDLKLPRKNGIEVLRTLRACEGTRYIPVVVLTTSALEEDMKRCYEAGANSFINKPVDFRTFCSHMEIVLKYWTEVNRQPSSRYGLSMLKG